MRSPDAETTRTPAGDVGRRGDASPVCGTERFEALEEVYDAAVPIDKIADDAPLSAMDGVLKDYVEKCNELGTDDALLAAYRRFCPLVADLRESLAAAGECEGEGGVQQCIDGVSTFRAVVRKFLSEGERYDAVVKRQELTAGV